MNLTLIFDYCPLGTTPSVGSIEKIFSDFNDDASIFQWTSRLSGFDNLISSTVGKHLSGEVIIFFLNSIDWGSTKNLGLSPLQVTLLSNVGNIPNLARVNGISNEYYLTSFGEKRNKNYYVLPPPIDILYYL